MGSNAALVQDYRKFEDVAFAKGYLQMSALESAIRVAEKNSQTIEGALVHGGWLTSRQVAEIYAELAGEECVALGDFEVSERIKEFSKHLETMLKYEFVPLKVMTEGLMIALENPGDSLRIRQIEQALGIPVVLRAASKDEIKAALGATQKAEATVSAPAPKRARPQDLKLVKEDELASDAGGGQNAKILDEILDQAIGSGASDIHIEPEENSLRVRVRVDGELVVLKDLEIELHARLISRLKVLAHLDIAEKRKAQDGSFRGRFSNRAVDFRVSTLPTVRGEKAVVRVLDKERLTVDLQELGFTPALVTQIQEVANLPYGIIFVTGPTGSGKTTTVYSILNYVNQISRNIVTVEDPVEFQFEVMNQVQVNEKAGVTFANILRNILRQDPDIIMIGEIRDRETAELAVRASLTGHLVISTMHTNDSISAVNRLADMGVEPYLLSSALSGVISQRLVRKLCSHCRESVTVQSDENKRLGPYALPAGTKVYRAKGCAHCKNTGYIGRQPIFEMFTPNEEVRAAVANMVSAADLEKLVRQHGYKSMREFGIQKVLEGVTTLDEILKATL